MKRNIFQSICWLLGGLLTLSACDDNNSSDTIYIPNAGAVVKVNFYIEDEPHVESFTVKLTANHYPDLNPIGSPVDATVHLEADPEKVAEYNAAKGTNYPVLPAAAYVVAPSAEIKAGQVESTPITITVNSKGNIEPFIEYLLPVSIVSAEGLATDHCCQTVYFLFRGAMDASNMELLDRTGWTVLGASSEESKEGDWGNSGLKEACIDGSINTFWSTAWEQSHPQPPHWITFDLGQSTAIQGFAIQARKEGNDGPKVVKFEVSDDGQNWTNAGEFKDIPAAGEYRTFLPQAVTGHFVKITITAVNGGPHVTVSEFNLF
ncbi:discoidin domain-containing protein [uncultured Bacteroides sp.]|uniref:discoidin domain-containing protein n=1 Tax=uncultured Bacteroides sp. TaxID=162156 RepID=UPI0025DE3A16|nr:discoidin domain-containing protein [uncultured Bacteroides sp.]